MNKLFSFIEKVLFQLITPGNFRFFLAFIVMVYHSVDFLTIGHYAVYVFFILSGYWIFRMYNEKYRQYANPYRVYIVSRLARLMPLYWLILLFSLLVYITVPTIFGRLANAGDHVFSIAFFNIFVIGLANAFHQFIKTAWSLDIEIQFYLLAPLLLFLFKKGSGWLLLGVSSVLALYLVYHHTKFESILIYLPYFLIGGAIYFFNFEASRQNVVIATSALVGILLINYLLPVIRTQYLLNRDAFVLGFNYREGLNVLLAILTVPFITVNVRQTLPAEKAVKDQLWSSMSYVLYLIHWPLLLVYSVCAGNAGLIQKVLYLSAFYIVSTLLSYLIARNIDVKFEKRRRSWISGIPKSEKFALQQVSI